MRGCGGDNRIVGAALLALLLAGAVAAAEPRPLSAVDRAALELAADYLTTGPAAWWEQLAYEAPLRQLSREQGLSEIEVRAGSPIGARWTLQTVATEAADRHAVFVIEFPSGVDEALTLSFADEAGELRLADLRILAEAVDPEAAAPAAAPAASPAEPAPPPAAASGSLVPMAALAAALAALALAFVLRRRRPLAYGLGALGLAAGVAAAVLMLATDGGPAPRASAPSEAAPAEPVPGERALGSLLAARRGLTEEGPEGREKVSEALAAEGATGRVARLWQAQYLSAIEDLNAMAEILADFPAPARSPLTEILRARLGYLRREEAETAAAYERALEFGGGYDGLLLEAAQVFEILGFEERASGYLRQLADMGSRQAEVYYALAEEAILDGRIPVGVEFFRTGWSLEPLERSQVLRRALLAGLLEDFSLRDAVGLASAEEPKAGCPVAPEAPLSLPPEASSRLLGSLLIVDLPDGELVVPGGCAVAPEAAVVYDAQSWRERREVMVLAELPEVREAALSLGALAQPQTRRKVEEAAEALARRNRWRELEELTGPLTSDLPRTPAAVVRLRAEALRRLGRTAEARDLLIGLAKSNIAKRRADPGTLFQLSELLASAGEYELAIRLIAKASSSVRGEFAYLRQQQLRMEKRLAESFAIHRSPHFEVRFPTSRSTYLAERIASILEAEHRRLQKWIPLPSGETIEVHLIPWSEFQANWGGGIELLGLFDGKIRLPFADVAQFNPTVVAILTHELAHAMIAERTGGMAPKWFHEALAQHVQMVQPRVNPIASYRLKKSLVAFPLLEDVLQSFASPALVTVAYDEARWSMHFIEKKYGVGRIHRLLDAFAAGRTTGEAVSEVFGLTVPDFDRRLWAWCVDEAPDVWTTRVVRYDEKKPFS